MHICSSKFSTIYANFNSESCHSLIGLLTPEYFGFLKLQVIPRFTGTGTCISPVPVNRNRSILTSLLLALPATVQDYMSITCSISFPGWPYPSVLLFNIDQWWAVLQCQVGPHLNQSVKIWLNQEQDVMIWGQDWEVQPRLYTWSKLV
jgi:hypothetical protein